MTLDMLSGIGIVAFAVSGAVVAIEEKYDVFGVYMLGFVTAFGGGAIRNVLLGVPVVLLWEQGVFFTTALAAITGLLFIPRIGFQYVRSLTIFDAVGLSAFALQGALVAEQAGLPLSACMAAAVLTGTGGGIVRDLLAGRRPLVLQRDVYATWALFGGFVVGLGHLEEQWTWLLLFIVMLVMRLLSVYYGWNLPRIPPYSRGNDSGR